MRVRDAQYLENALYGAILADAPMQGIKGDVGLQPCQNVGDRPIDLDPGDPVALLLERFGASLTRSERDLALGGPAAHQHRNVFGHRSRSGKKERWRDRLARSRRAAPNARH